MKLFNFKWNLTKSRLHFYDSVSVCRCATTGNKIKSIKVFLFGCIWKTCLHNLLVRYSVMNLCSSLLVGWDVLNQFSTWRSFSQSRIKVPLTWWRVLMDTVFLHFRWTTGDSNTTKETLRMCRQRKEKKKRGRRLMDVNDVGLAFSMFVMFITPQGHAASLMSCYLFTVLSLIQRKK